MRFHPRPAVTSMLCAALLAACGPSAATEERLTDDGRVVIHVRDNAFSPAANEVGVGETVVWDFSTARRSHNVVFTGDRSSDTLDDGTWTTTFDEPGVYFYECTLHNGMTGQITVVGS